MMTRPCCTRSTFGWSHLLMAVGLSVVFGCGDTLDQLEGDGGPTFTSIYESDEFQLCSSCHAAGAPGRMEGIETTQDWSTRERALATLRGSAAGLQGNFAACNGVPFLGGSAGQSLLVASLDSSVRASFSNPSFPGCTGDDISDQTLKIKGELPPALLKNLKDWIDAGAPGN